MADEIAKPVEQPVAQPPSKKWYLSKTLWTNFLLGVLVTAVPSLSAKLNADTLAWGFMVINSILRFVTKDKLEIK